MIELFNGVYLHHVVLLSALLMGVVAGVIVDEVQGK